MSLPDPNPELQYPEPAAPVKALRVGDELVIPLDAGFALVASKTEVDTWHVVEHRRCTCPGFRYRESCRHVDLVARLTTPGVKKGDWPDGWASPAVLDEAELAGPPPEGGDTELARIFGGR